MLAKRADARHPDGVQWRYSTHLEPLRKQKSGRKLGKNWIEQIPGDLGPGVSPALSSLWHAFCKPMQFHRSGPFECSGCGLEGLDIHEHGNEAQHGFVMVRTE